MNSEYTMCDQTDGIHCLLRHFSLLIKTLHDSASREEILLFAHDNFSFVLLVMQMVVV